MSFLHVDPAIPILAIIGWPALFVVLPAGLLSVLFGGRWLAVALGFLGLAMAWFTYDVLTGPPRPGDTGMDGIVILVMPLLWAGAAVGAWLTYLAVRFFEYLPHQRRHRREAG